MSGSTQPGGVPALVHLVGVGPGAVDLLTVRASRLIALSGTCLYEHGTVPPQVMSLCPPAARVVDITSMSTADTIAEIRAGLGRGDRVVQLFPGDPTQHPSLGDRTRALNAAQTEWELVPGIPAPTSESDTRPQTPASTLESTMRSQGSMPNGDPGLILILGGTEESRRLADLMTTAGLDVVTSLPGKVSRRRLPRGEVRIGGFGGADGLAHWMRQHAVNAVIDATDPFATEISESAILASGDCGVPVLQLHRPPWVSRAGDDWIHVADMAAAARVVSERFRRPMLTVGKQGASAFVDDARGSYLIRCSEPPPGALPHRYLLVLDRGPFGFESERTLMSRHRIDVLVTRNSGGENSRATLEAARDLVIPVVMVERPDAPDAPETAHSVDEAARWLVARFSSR